MKASSISLEPDGLVLAKADAYKGEESEWLVGGGNVWSGMSSHRGHPFLHPEKPVDRTLISPSAKLTFPHFFYRGDPYLYGCGH